jgi:signal transduction histidine kinase
MINPMLGPAIVSVRDGHSKANAKSMAEQAPAYVDIATPDFRTPLHAIKGNLEIVLAGERPLLSSCARHSFDQIMQAVDDLEAMLRLAGLLCDREVHG